MTPSYLNLVESGELTVRALEAASHLSACDLCPRRCGVNRVKGEMGFCKTGQRARVASWQLHFGEEEPLVGEAGSGTIFFAGCNLACVFCQNYDISHASSPDQEATSEQLAAIMLDLKKQGAANINFVTPSHVVPQILEALDIAARAGLDLPLVFNSGGYDSVETLTLLDGIVDIYMPDVKFASPEAAKKYCKAADYPEICKAAVVEMHRQVGSLDVDQETGLAGRGLLVRHLVMPGGVAGTLEWMEFLANEVSRATYVNVMDQYRPCGEAGRFPEIGRGITPEEFAQAKAWVKQAGVTRTRELDANLFISRLRLNHFLPDGHDIEEYLFDETAPLSWLRMLRMFKL